MPPTPVSVQFSPPPLEFRVKVADTRNLLVYRYKGSKDRPVLWSWVLRCCLGRLTSESVVRPEDKLALDPATGSESETSSSASQLQRSRYHSSPGATKNKRGHPGSKELRVLGFLGLQPEFRACLAFGPFRV